MEAVMFVGHDTTIANAFSRPEVLRQIVEAILDNNPMPIAVPVDVPGGGRLEIFMSGTIETNRPVTRQQEWADLDARTERLRQQLEEEDER